MHPVSGFGSVYGFDASPYARVGGNLKPSPGVYFLGYPACIPPVSRLYLTVSLASRCIPVSIYI